MFLTDIKQYVIPLLPLLYQTCQGNLEFMENSDQTEHRPGSILDLYWVRLSHPI